MIKQELLTQPTGNLFADIGGLVIKYLLPKPELKGMSISQLISWLTDVYIEHWNLKLHAILPDSSTTIFEYDDERKKQEVLYYFSELLMECRPVAVGRCIITGRNEPLFKAGRYGYMLSDNGKDVVMELLVSKYVLIRSFFALFGAQRLAGTMYTPCSSDETLNRYIVYQNCELNFNSLGAGASKSILRRGYTYPSWQVFMLVDYYLEVIRKNVPHRVIKDPGICLYYWSTAAEEQSITRYLLTSNTFSFYRYCSQEFPQVWKSFIMAHAVPNNTQFILNHEKNHWETRAGDIVSFQEVTTWPNRVLDGLLHERSLLPFFKKWAVTKALPVEVVHQYATAIRNVRAKVVRQMEELAAQCQEQAHDRLV